MQILEELSGKLYGENNPEKITAHDAADKLAGSYSEVLGAARQSIHVKELTTDTLRLIKSQARDFEPEVITDPLYRRIVAERSVFESFADENGQAISANRTIKVGVSTLRDQRNRLYIDYRNLFLIHTWRPSIQMGQVADISIRLTEHVRRGPKAGQASTEHPLTDGIVEKVEYDLGSTFRTFEKHNAEADFRLDISAYGPTMCFAKVYFRDNHPPITLYRYLDFIPASPESAGVSPS